MTTPEALAAARPDTATALAPGAGDARIPRAGFELRTFAPSWGASVMGTSALAVALLAVGEQTSWASATQAAARTVLLVAVLMGVVVIGLTAARWIRFRGAALADLRHPVKGGMTATAAGALLTLAVAIGRVGPGFLPEAAILPAVTVLASTGALLALTIGWEFLGEILTSRDAALAQMSGAWFVPPVVTIIVPLALLPLVPANQGIAADLVALSWAFLGMGAVLYLVVTATLFMRSISHPLPPAGLAPTLFIGMGPAGLLGLDMVRLAQVSVQTGVAPESLLTAVLPVASMAWGFGLWWLVSALIVLRRGYEHLPFTLSWWGFTFPLAAWTIATIVLGRAWDSSLLTGIAWIATAALTALWAYVGARTVAGIRSGSIWAH
jgi:C4-dicarboxylate transporter/malic acid transport protein